MNKSVYIKLFNLSVMFVIFFVHVSYSFWPLNQNIKLMILWDQSSLGLGTVHIWTGTFFRYFTLCNNKNIYFSEKISPKLSISTFWTIGPYNFFLIFFW